MIVTTTDTICGQSFEYLGLVTGSIVQAKSFTKDIMANIQNLVGGEMDEYTEMMQESRIIATQRMIADAERLGAHAIVSARFSTMSISDGAAEVLAYGTAIRYVAAQGAPVPAAPPMG